MSNQVKLSIEAEGDLVPQYETAGSAGLDLRSNNSVEFVGGDWHVIDTGVKVRIPEGYVGLICSRSGLAAKHGVSVLNGPGVIDSDFRGKIKVILHSLTEFKVKKGDRIAQLVLMPFVRGLLTVEKISDKETARGANGLGSTGV